MKYATAATLLSAAGALAAPAIKTAPRQTSNVTDTSSTPLGFIFPNVLSIHNVNTNLNVISAKTDTVRVGNSETSTLYQLPIPPNTSGHTCGLVIFAGENGDTVSGTGALDIFNNNIQNLAALGAGNFRNQELARVVFDPATGLFGFDTADVVPLIESFPCPAGKTLEWESVAVGTSDTVIIQQDFSFDGVNIPNGLTIAFW